MAWCNICSSTWYHKRFVICNHSSKILASIRASGLRGELGEVCSISLIDTIPVKCLYDFENLIAKLLYTAPCLATDLVSVIYHFCGAIPLAVVGNDTIDWSCFYRYFIAINFHTDDLQGIVLFVSTAIHPCPLLLFVNWTTAKIHMTILFLICMLWSPTFD